MATQRYISTSFWTDKWIRSLDPSERYLYMYLLTNPETNIAGVYKITMDRIAFDTGYDERTLTPMIERFEKAGKAYFYKEEWVVLPTWPKHQQWEKRSKIKMGIDALLRNLPKDVITYIISIGYRYPIKAYAYEPNYSDLDSDLDSDSDTDIDIDSASLPSRYEKNREYWNSAKLKPCKYNQLQCPNIRDLIPTFDVQSDHIIQQAIDNYKTITTDKKYKPFPVYPSGFLGFMKPGAGVDQYCDESAPFKRCLKEVDPLRQPIKNTNEPLPKITPEEKREMDRLMKNASVLDAIHAGINISEKKPEQEEDFFPTPGERMD